MLQLLDLARENAALKDELTRIREEAEMLRRLLSPDRDHPGEETTLANALG
jgi:hypothetical protein